MAAPTTTKYEELVLEWEQTPLSGTYTSICGLVGVTITRTAQVDETESPADCDDESLPLVVERQVRSLSVAVSGTGVAAVQSFPALNAWWRSGSTRNVRIRNTRIQTSGVSGDIYIESGAALLTSLGNDRQKGSKVTFDLDIQFDGLPAATAVG